MRIKDILNIKKKYKGAILVEFALGASLLATILYYASDVPRYQRWKTDMKNAAYIAASMIQNVSKNRDDKRVTRRDIVRIGHSCYATIWKGCGSKWTCLGGNIYPTGTLPVMAIFYIKGTATNKAQIMWYSLYSSHVQVSASSNIYSSGAVGSVASLLYGINLNAEYISTSLHKDLKINNGEVKILLELYLQTNREFTFNGSTPAWGSASATSVPSSLFGFYLLKPKATVPRSTTTYGFFNTVVIFSPRSGLFSETPPS